MYKNLLRSQKRHFGLRLSDGGNSPGIFWPYTHFPAVHSMNVQSPVQIPNKMDHVMLRGGVTKHLGGVYPSTPSIFKMSSVRYYRYRRYISLQKEPRAASTHPGTLLRGPRSTKKLLDFGKINLQCPFSKGGFRGICSKLDNRDHSFSGRA